MSDIKSRQVSLGFLRIRPSLFSRASRTSADFERPVRLASACNCFSRGEGNFNEIVTISLW